MQKSREVRDHLPTVKGWAESARQAFESGAAAPAPSGFPEYPFGERRHRPQCVTLHNGMIAPLEPYGVRGLLWRQSENNAGSAADAEQYGEKLKALVKDWRPPPRRTTPSGEVAIAGEDRQWRRADAHVEGDTVILSHSGIDQPIAVRYVLCANPVRENLDNPKASPRRHSALTTGGPWRIRKNFASTLLLAMPVCGLSVD